jgi:hypothetical protein
MPRPAESLAEMYGDIYIRAPPNSKKESKSSGQNHTRQVVLADGMASCRKYSTEEAVDYPFTAGGINVRNHSELTAYATPL